MLPGSVAAPKVPRPLPKFEAKAAARGAWTDEGKEDWRVRGHDGRRGSRRHRHPVAAVGAIAQALNDFKVEVAREHPTAKALQASEERLTSAINKLTERIDRWLERQP